MAAVGMTGSEKTRSMVLSALEKINVSKGVHVAFLVRACRVPNVTVPSARAVLRAQPVEVGPMPFSFA